MNLSPAKAVRQIGEFWQKQGKKRQRIIIALLVGIVILSVAVAALLNHTTYTVLYAGLSSDEAGVILARLDEMSVKTQVKDGGTILVPEGDEARLKMQLAADGYPRSAQNYDLFSQNVDFMTTDYEKRQYLIFQLQNRLQTAIETLGGVKSAIVTISVPEENGYVLTGDAIPATASVVLELSSPAGLDKQQIYGIEYLVANSVPGLESKNVAVIDSNATLLNNPGGDSTVLTDKLSIETNINREVESKVIKLLQPVFGYSAVRVAVNTTIDLSSKVSQQKTYNPTVGEGGIISRQDLTQETNDGTVGAFGIPGIASNAGTTVYPEEDAGGGEGSSSASASTDYLVDEYYEQVEKNGYEIRDITVSVIIGKPNMTDTQIAKYRQAVAFAAGVPEERVSVTAAEFLAGSSGLAPQPQETVPGLTTIIKENPILFAAGALMLLLLTAGLIFFVKKTQAKKQAAQEAAQAQVAAAAPEETTDILPGGIVLNETRAQSLKRQIKDFSATNPDIVAQLLRTWLKEEQ
ncbi:MAG TPA: flagellar basal-body MS-ring/collar protein FliF [Terriglobales bacterium]|nr:flagellar basal-body MS-ring/collar protein FliF [Terriglobales bacterium]